MAPPGAETHVVSLALFEENADPIVVTDEAGTIVLANDACLRLLGYRPDTLVGRPVEVLVPKRFQRHAHDRSDYTASPRPRSMGQGLLLWVLHADGHEIPADIALTPLRANGQSLVAATIRDLRGRAFESETVRLHAKALRAAANGIVITDRSGVITWANPAACAMTGYTHEELIGQHTRILKSGRHDPALYESLWKTITAGETWIGSLVNRRKDGSFYDEEQTIAPVFAENGELAYFIAIKQDVTKRCQAEAALALAHSELALRLAEIETLNQRLSEQAIRDPLTNLYNRRHFEEAVRRDAAHAARAGALLTIAVLDVDCFKNVNDTYGHAVGDSVLQALAGILVREVRQSELACRMGGDEFAVVLRDTPLVAAANSADRWRAAFASAPIAAGRGGTVQASVSIGVAPYHASVESLEDAMHRADAALYEAKRLGRNRVVVSAETLDPA